MLRLATGQWRDVGGWSQESLVPELDSEQTLVLAFGATRNSDRLSEVVETYPRSHIIGCSTAGEILGDTLDEDSVVVATAKFEHTTLRTAYAAVQSKNGGYAAGCNLARQLQDPALKAVFILSDGHTVNGSELVRGVNETLGANVVVTGGLAGDGDRFERTWVLSKGKPTDSVVSAVGFYGDDFIVSHGCRAGWDKFGVERQVTRSDGNILYELDGVPALDLYKRYLGEQADELPAAALLFPLAVRESSSTRQQLIRTVLNIDEQKRAMIFAGDVPEGTLAQFMMANLDKLVESAGQAARVASLSARPPGPSLSIAVTCVGRRLILGGRTEDELEASLEALPPGSAQVGFYSYGELCPGSEGLCALHNQTMTVTILSEAA